MKHERPAWVRCPCCENFWCNLHQKHAHECPCPEAGAWERSPYGRGSCPKPPYPNCPFPRCDGEPVLTETGWQCSSGLPHFLWSRGVATK